VTVVVPAYRCEDTIERAVSSAIAQRPSPTEVIVIDDASPDSTGARAEALGARVVRHEHNRGEGAARNTGLATAGEPWVALLDADDEWLPGHLAALWDAHDGHVLVGAAALGCGARPQDHRARGWSGPCARTLRRPPDAAVPENKLTASSVLVRRDAALAAGGFRPDLRRATDLDLWLRMLEHGTARVLPRVTALYHQHGTQVSADRASMDDAAQAVLAGYADRPWCTRSVRRRVEGRVAWDTARAMRAAGAPAARVLPQLVRSLASPARMRGMAETLAGRHWARRLTARHAPGGGPSVAILPGVSELAAPAGAVDLRDQGRLRALATLAWRPTAAALVPGPAAAILVRALGVRPVSASRGRAGTAR
jgi:hypothetical protein